MYETHILIPFLKFFTRSTKFCLTGQPFVLGLGVIGSNDSAFDLR